MIDSHGLRRNFLDYFTRLGHEEVPSASLVPVDDPTLLFTNAGMNQFKGVFLGQERRPAARVADVQKCLRVSGKHNDLEEVGGDEHHHTFFEMLGNWSFNDYYKAEAIEFAWNYLTKELSLNKERLWPTVYEQDEETFALWPKVTGISPSKVLKFGAKDNFWEMGEVGPCGPCTEINYDRGPDYGPDYPKSAPNDPHHHRWIEIWNLVFIQYSRGADGALTALSERFVDTGMGFERLLALLQGVGGNYRTDLFVPLLNHLEALIHGRETIESDPIAFRAISDHVRTLTFGISDGVMPANEGRGYVLRRILRRAARYGRRLGLEEPFLYRLCGDVVETMGLDYPEIRAASAHVTAVVRAEEESFGVTLDRGLALFHKEKERVQSIGKRVFPADAVFKLYDTFGFPPDLTLLMAQEEGLGVDMAGFETLMEARRKDSRRTVTTTVSYAETSWRGPEGERQNVFVGYERLRSVTKILQIEPEETLSRGEEGWVMLAETPFYPEGGGQVYDQGWIEGSGVRARVLEAARKKPGSIVVKVHVESGTLEAGSEVEAVVDEERRLKVQAHHTGTHLLHAALRKILGSHVRQAGSLVAPDRLRFDFNHYQPVTRSELLNIQETVNRWVDSDFFVEVAVDVPLEDARQAGAMAFFGEKYGDKVRVVKVPGVSIELCGGTHMNRTSRVGLMWIYSENGIAAGVRRIEAACGRGLLERTVALDGRIERMSRILGGPKDEMEERVEKLTERVRMLEEERGEMRLTLHAQRMATLINAGKKVNDVRVVGGTLLQASRKELRAVADQMRESEQRTVMVLASEEGDRLQLLAAVTDDLLDEGVHAGRLIGELAKRMGGRGGGRPHLAEAGARVEQAGATLEDLESIVASLVEQQLCASKK